MWKNIEAEKRSQRRAVWKNNSNALFAESINAVKIAELRNVMDLSEPGNIDINEVINSCNKILIEAAEKSDNIVTNRVKMGQKIINLGFIRTARNLEKIVIHVNIIIGVTRVGRKTLRK